MTRTSDNDARLTVEPETFASHYPERAFRVRHRLTGHPLLTIEALLALVQRLPERLIEYNSGDLPIGQDPSRTPRNGLSPAETIARIRDNRSWLVLKLIEHDPAYKALLNDCLDGVMTLAERRTPGTGQREGYIFVSSPGSVTPFHIDNEHNFLLQVQGTKTIHIWPADDREVLSEQQLEAYHCGAHRNLPYSESLAPRGVPYRLMPGDGVFVPITAPHWVKNGDEVSISLSVTYRSRYAEQQTAVYRCNHLLRSIGLRPKPFQGGVWTDSLKWQAIRAADRVRWLTGLSADASRPT